MRLLLIALLAFGAVADASTRRTDTCWNGRYYEHGHCPAPYEVITEGVFVDPSDGGSDSGTFANPFTSFPTSGISTSEDVWVMEDTVFEDQRLQPSWSGNLGDRSIIGTYCVKNGDPIRWNASDCSGEKAEWNGDYEAACRAAGTCDVDNGSAIPTTRFAGILQPSGDYLTFLNIKIKDSAGAGAYITGRDYITLDHVDVLYTAASSVRMNGGTSSSAILGGEFGWSALCHANVSDYSSCTNWPPAIHLCQGGSQYNIIEGAWVHDSWGEGIGCYQNNSGGANSGVSAAYAIIRFNVVECTRSSGLYSSGTGSSVYESNIVWDPSSGTCDTSEYGDWKASSGWEGVGINAENDYDDQDSDYNLVRNNVIYGKEDCFRFGIGSNNPALGIVVGVDAFHNTCILTGGTGAETGVEIGATLSPSAVGTFSKIANNITYAPSLSNGALCQFPDSQWDFGANSWSGTPSDSDCQASGSAYNTTPSLGTAAGSWSFSQTGSPGAGPQESDFADAGNATGDALQAVILDWDDYQQASLMGSAAGYVPDSTAWEKEAAYDFNGDLRSVTAPTMGADE